MIRNLLYAAALLALAACSAASSPAGHYPQSNPPVAVAARQPPPYAPPLAPAPEPFRNAPDDRAARVSCEILAQRTRNGLRLEAVSSAARASSYEFVVTKNGRSGSSDIVQGGPVPSGGGALSAAEIDAGGRYRAVLRILDGRREVCRDELSNR